MAGRTLDELRQLKAYEFHSVTAEDLASYPTMERWFNPVLLAKLLLQVVVSKAFGQFADRRLTHAALDTVSDEALVARADIVNFAKADDEGAIWIDFVADLGDGFDSTYAIAYLLAQEVLDVDNASTRRGSVLIMGGDEVYPVASRDNYILRMRHPNSFAFPDRRGQSHPLVHAIPGNHDWYDGLVVFLAMFCRHKSTPLGEWRTRQRRSYFAIQLKPDWWIWGIDIALTEDMDQPQADYFALMARSMKLNPNSKLILCSAEPGWYKAELKAESYRSLDYAAWILKNEGTDARIVAVLSGDTHHYARYSSEFGTQFITSGGGGAFLHGTQDLKDELRAEWFYHGESPLSLSTSPDVDHAPSTESACYPTQGESRRLARGNLGFWHLNWDFSLFLGIIYWLLGYVLVLRPGLDAHVIVFLVLAAGFVGYACYQERKKLKAAGLAALHALVHWGILSSLALLFAPFNTQLLGDPPGWGWFFLFGLEIVPLGSVLAGFIFGLNLLLTCCYANMNHNDAFSALRLNSYRHFLRLRIKGDEVSVYPISLDRIPCRSEWTKNTYDNIANGQSLFTPPSDLIAHLIEGPIIISANRVAPAVKAVASNSPPQKSPSSPT